VSVVTLSISSSEIKVASVIMTEDGFGRGERDLGRFEFEVIMLIFNGSKEEDGSREEDGDRGDDSVVYTVITLCSHKGVEKSPKVKATQGKLGRIVTGSISIVLID
jgi:hypothetical protein